MKYSYDIAGTAADGQTWETTGTVECEFVAAYDRAMRASFAQLTGGKAVYGEPGKGCNGPYKINRVEIREQAG